MESTHLGTQVSKNIVVEPRLLLGQLGKSDRVIEIEDEIRQRLGDDISIGSHLCCCVKNELSRKREINAVTGLPTGMLSMVLL